MDPAPTSMIIPYIFRPVGEWRFLREPTGDGSTEEEPSVVLDWCTAAAAVLESHDLLRVERVDFTGWIGPDPEGQTEARRSQTVVFLTRPGFRAAEFRTACEGELARLVKEVPGSRFSDSLYVFGSGTVFNAEGKKVHLPLVTWIHGSLLGGPYLQVRTQCDAFLPYTLLAEPQPEVYARNAPRLEAALREIEAVLGVPAEPEEVTRYAVADGLRLRNHHSGDEIVDAVAAREVEDIRAGEAQWAESFRKSP